MSAETGTAQPSESTAPPPSATDPALNAAAPHIKPRARGWIHLYSAVAALVAGTVLVAVSWPLRGAITGLATMAYTGAIVLMFAVSAVYHRVHWPSVLARTRMKRLDHSMIFVFIAGSYTPFALVAMPDAAGETVFFIVWGGALAGIMLNMCWPTAPRWVGVPLYLLLGWVAAWFAPAILHGAGVAAFVLLAVGGAMYSIGGVFYGMRWPDPWPKTFGYHEVFHACTAVAALCHYIAMWFAVL